jgi:hypothetical protein
VEIAYAEALAISVETGEDAEDNLASIIFPPAY